MTNTEDLQRYWHTQPTNLANSQASQMAWPRSRKDILCGELSESSRPIGLRYKDVCKCDMKLANIGSYN